MNIFKKFTLLLLSTLLFMNSMITPFAVAAQEPESWYNQSFNTWYPKVYGKSSLPSEIFGERYTAAQVQWILYSLFSFPINLLGTEAQELLACVLETPGGVVFDTLSCNTEMAAFLVDIFLKISPIVQTDDGSDLAFTDTIFVNYKNGGLSGIGYTVDLLSKFGTVSEANAQTQGFGYNSINSLQKYWKGFRDIAYAISVLIIVVFAFMIMFRIKISPQLVISVQSALPKVILALILATFSYAIAGFVIDLSYVVGGLLASLMVMAGFAEPFGTATAFQTAYNTIVPEGGTVALGAFYIFGWMLVYTIGFFFTAVITTLGTVHGLSLYGWLASAIAVLVSIWVFILMIWYTITVPWMLIKNLISLFVSIVVAPVQILAGAITPAIGFGTWFRKILAEALVFPLAGLFMFLAGKTLRASVIASFGQSWFSGSAYENLWAPPILGSSDDMAGILWLAVSFTFVTMIPKSVEIMKMLIMGAKFDFGSAMGQAAGPVKSLSKLGLGYWGGRESEEGQEEYRRGNVDIGKGMIRRGEALKTLSGVIR